MSKDKVETSIASDMEEESHVTVKHSSIKRDAYYIAPFDGPSQSITQVQLKENNKDNNYNEWAKAIRLALHSNRKLGFIDGLILEPKNDPDKEEEWWEINTLIHGSLIPLNQPMILYTFF